MAPPGRLVSRAAVRPPPRVPIAAANPPVRLGQRSPTGRRGRSPTAESATIRRHRRCHGWKTIPNARRTKPRPATPSTDPPSRAAPSRPVSGGPKRALGRAPEPGGNICPPPPRSRFRRPITAPPGVTPVGSASTRSGIIDKPVRSAARSRGVAVFVRTRFVSRSRSDTLERSPWTRVRTL